MGKENLTGHRYGIVTVTGVGKKDGKSYKWKCLCDCGNECYVTKSNLQDPRFRSCGCLRKRRGKSHPNYKGTGELSGTFFCNLQKRARERGKEWHLSKYYLWNLFRDQGGRCAYSGDVLTLPDNQSDGNASLDRVNSAVGYVEGNVEWVTQEVNFMKHQQSRNDFIDLCRRIVLKEDAKCGF